MASTHHFAASSILPLLEPHLRDFEGTKSLTRFTDASSRVIKTEVFEEHMLMIQSVIHLLKQLQLVHEVRVGSRSNRKTG